MPASRDELIDRQRILADFGELAIRCDTLQTILDEACKLVSRALDTDLAKILELEPATNTALIRAGHGWRPGTVGNRLSMDERSSETFSLRGGIPVVTQDIATEDRFRLAEILREHGVVSIVNAPIFLPGGRAYGLLQVDARMPRAFDEEDVEFLRTYCAVLGPVIDRLFVIDERDKASERFKLVADNAHDFAIILSDADDIITDWFPGAVEVLGWSEEEMVGQPIHTIFTPEDRENGIPERETGRAREAGKAPNVRWHMTKGGERVFLDGQTIVLPNPDGSVRGFLKIGQNLTERKEHEERQGVLLAELQHRVRNVLAMIASLVKRADVTVSTHEFRERLSGRIAAMARTQALLTRGGDTGVELESLVRDELTAQSAEDDRVTIDGPAVMLAPKAAEVLTLAAHELATNAAKYGALLQPSGRIAVSWEIGRRADKDWLTLQWQESGVRNVAGKSRGRGFGTELVTRRVPYELNGEGSLDVTASGLLCRIAFPLAAGDSILQTNSPPLPHARETVL